MSYTQEEIDAIIKRYEFIADHAEYIEIEFKWGGRDKIYVESDGIDCLNTQIDESIKMNDHTGDE
jgi:hypothetical protein